MQDERRTDVESEGEGHDDLVEVWAGVLKDKYQTQASCTGGGVEDGREGHAGL